jgi:hypothetical protein
LAKDTLIFKNNEDTDRRKKLKFKFEGVWGDGFIPFALLWGSDGIGICIFSFVFGVTFA